MEHLGSMPRRLWVEKQDASDACDVIVEMEDGAYYTAAFVTVPYLRRQMSLSYEVGKQFTDVPAVPYAVMETPHILVENLDRDTIEDAIDNLLALDTFETVFTLALNTSVDDPAGTAEVAAVVLTEILKAEDDTVA